MSKGTFDKLDETFTVLTIFSSFNWVYEWYDPNGKFTPEQIAENLIKADSGWNEEVKVKNSRNQIEDH